MQIGVHYQNLDDSPWVEQFVENRVKKLERYLDNSASIQVNLSFENNFYVTIIVIHNLNHEYTFTAEGMNLYESFSLTIDKATKALGEQKRKIRDRINRRFFPLKHA